MPDMTLHRTPTASEELQRIAEQKQLETENTLLKAALAQSSERCRGIAEGVFRRTSDGRAAMARQAAAEQRAAEEAARRAEQERQRELEQLEQEHREIEKRQRKSFTHDFGPTL